MNSDIVEKFFYSVWIKNGCWEWLWSLDANGYGKANWYKTNFLAHRLSYQLHVGPLDPTLTIDHTCFNRRCVNPKHLEQVTQAENARRSNPHQIEAKMRNKTHCKNGHEFTKENTRIISKKSRARTCIKCFREYHRKYEKARRLRIKENR